MSDPLATARLGTMAPFFIVSDVPRSLDFYAGRLGFAVVHRNDEQAPFFAMLQRDGAMLFVKSESGIAPVPNSARHRHLRWDAYCFTPDPDALAEQVAQAGVAFARPLANSGDGLRGFELADPDGHILFFGRPLQDGD